MSSASSTSGFKEIFAYDKRIRFCGVIDDKGKIKQSKSRENLNSLNPDSEEGRLFSQIGLAVLMDRGWDKFFGRTKVIAISKEKLNILIYSLADLRAVVITTDPDLPLDRIGEIGELIDVSDVVTSERESR